MIPSNYKKLIPKVAEITGFSEELCSEVIEDFWGEVRKAVSLGKAPRVYLNNLGYFKVSIRKLEEKILGYHKLSQNIGLYKSPHQILYFAKWRSSILKKIQDTLIYDKFRKRKTNQIRKRMLEDIKKSIEDSGGTFESYYQEQRDRTNREKENVNLQELP